SRRYLAPRMYGILIGILLLDALILATAVLLQAGQGGGLASMGGGAGTETIMGGRQATTLLTKVTWWTAGIFLFLALILTFMSQSANQVRSAIELARDRDAARLAFRRGSAPRGRCRHAPADALHPFARRDARRARAR